MFGDLIGFIAGMVVFAVDTFVLYFLVGSALGRHGQSVTSLMLFMMLGKVFLLLTSLYTCFVAYKISGISFVFGAFFSLIIFVIFISAKETLSNRKQVRSKYS